MRRFTFPAVTGLLMAAPVLAAPADYTFSVIAQTGTGSTFSDLNNPAISDTGEVAFRSVRTTGGAAIYRGSPTAAPTPVATVDGSFASFSPRVTINATGTVAFRATSDAGSGVGEGIYYTTGPIVQPMFTSGAASGFTGLETPYLNNAGNVAFFGTRTNGGIFRTITPTTFTPIDDGATRLVFSNQPTLNEAGQVAYNGATFDTGSPVGHVYVGNGGTPLSVVDTGATSPFSLVADPVINETGSVAFLADRKSGGGTGLYTVPTTGGSVTTIVDTDGAYARVVAAAFNDAGDVAFFGLLDGTGTPLGIFTGPDAVADRVLRTGDSFLGSTVDLISLSSGALNEFGQIAFTVTLTDGREAVVVATPIPEPGAISLFAGASSLLLARRRSRRA